MTALLTELSNAVITTFGHCGRGNGAPSGMDDLIEDLAQALVDGECDEPAEGTFAATCMDDRLRTNGTDPLLPNVAGGCFGLLLAARAVHPAYDLETCTARRFMQILKDDGLPVYAHIDQQFPESDQTGCVFNDRMSLIGTIGPQIADDMMTRLGADPETRMMASGLADRIRLITSLSDAGTDPFGEDGLSRLKAVRDAGGTIEVLRGSHAPLGADISFRYGQTLSRNLLDADHAVKLFHLDAWSFAPTAAKLVRILPRSAEQADSHTSEEDLIAQMTMAMLLTGFSAMSVICSPETLLVIRS